MSYWLNTKAVGISVFSTKRHASCSKQQYPFAVLAPFAVEVVYAVYTGAGASTCASGSVSVSVVPRPTSLVTVTRPP